MTSWLVFGLVTGFLHRALGLGEKPVSLVMHFFLSLSGGLFGGFTGETLLRMAPDTGVGALAATLGAATMLIVAQRD